MKIIIKKLFFLCCLLVMLPFSLAFKILAQALNQDQLTSSFSQFLSILPGKTGSYLRAGFYRVTLTNCSPDALISFGTLLSQQDTDIGAGVYIGPQCNIGKCAIGKNTLLGSGVHIMSGKGQHNFSDPNVPIKDQGGSFTKVIIGENCWIGNCALIMANVGAGSVVAAGAVVVNNVPDGVVVGGNPAKILKQIG
jgi:virginiamycin A acetyltransferase